ncbi:hypothetical protein M378DRAFT_539051 [Amanita muscaria Koide BX008]|uniref:Uncharacterized protein n=1 Tax=Amanita muscaria (strain Koide BX008) TaxID=946122 RepID=A0A0C2X999_AMAMK|nr:hypothetical protein M378DRAFT_539051 [Amanita muscaria Koide BX008]
MSSARLQGSSLPTNMRRIGIFPARARSLSFASHRTFLLVAIYHLVLPDHNYHHAVVLDITLGAFQSVLTFTVLPMPAYSATDPLNFWTILNQLAPQPGRRLPAATYPSPV